MHFLNPYLYIKICPQVVSWGQGYNSKGIVHLPSVLYNFGTASRLILNWLNKLCTCFVLTVNLKLLRFILVNGMFHKGYHLLRAQHTVIVVELDILKQHTIQRHSRLTKMANTKERQYILRQKMCWACSVYHTNCYRGGRRSCVRGHSDVASFAHSNYFFFNGDAWHVRSNPKATPSQHAFVTSVALRNGSKRTTGHVTRMNQLHRITTSGGKVNQTNIYSNIVEY